MKVLILTYYWPPAGGSGVQRWLKFVKYLPDFGITPVVYTVQNPRYALEDASLLAEVPEGTEVVRQPIWEPYQWANFFSSGKARERSVGFLGVGTSFLGKIATYVRSNFFIPDARKFWVKPSVTYLQKYLQDHPVDLVISTGPPHSVHLIALALKERMGLKWMADFRDPWTIMGYFDKLSVSERTLRMHQKLSTEVLQNSDAVVVVGNTMQKEYLSFNKNTHVLTNGFDRDLSKRDAISANELDEGFTISHIGLMNEDQNPVVLWNVLAELGQEIEGFFKDLQVQLIGKVAPSVLAAISSCGLMDQLKMRGYVPHKEVFNFQKKSQILLVCINQVSNAGRIITGKIFEYMAANRPVVVIGPEDGDLAEIVNHTRSGYVFDHQNHTGLKEKIRSMYGEFLEKRLKIESINVDQYHRREITRQLAQLAKQTLR